MYTCFRRFICRSCFLVPRSLRRLQSPICLATWPFLPSCVLRFSEAHPFPPLHSRLSSAQHSLFILLHLTCPPILLSRQIPRGPGNRILNPMIRGARMASGSYGGSRGIVGGRTGSWCAPVGAGLKPAPRPMPREHRSQREISCDCPAPRIFPLTLAQKSSRMGDIVRWDSRGWWGAGASAKRGRDAAHGAWPDRDAAHGDVTPTPRLFSCRWMDDLGNEPTERNTPHEDCATTLSRDDPRCHPDDARSPRLRRDV